MPEQRSAFAGPGRPALLGRRGALLVALLVAGALSFWRLGLSPRQLVPPAGGARLALEFFAAARRPALDYEAEWVPAGAPPLWLVVLTATWRTLAFATAAMSLALLASLPLAFLASSSRWNLDTHAPTVRLLAPSVQAGTRLLIALLRSVHELLWAVILLAALGLSPGTAVVAIALPYAGTLAKVFSEMLDEAPEESARALRDLGASRGVVFLFGRLPRALPDMAAYAFYRFECAVRSAAVLGFFGFPTLGYYLKASFDNLHMRETWTWLWALTALVVAFELWSSHLRRRFVA
jgi:phosphonate transport system permease protein